MAQLLHRPHVANARGGSKPRARYTYFAALVGRSRRQRPLRRGAGLPFLDGGVCGRPGKRSFGDPSPPISDPEVEDDEEDAAASDGGATWAVLTATTRQ